MRTVSIEVIQSGRSDTTRRAYALPVKVGRGADCDIQLDAEDRRISRLHAEIVQEGNRLVLRNRASNLNSTHFHGRPLQPNEQADVAVGDVITIFDFGLKIMEPADIGLIFTSRKDLKPRAEHHLVTGGAVLAYVSTGRLVVEPVTSLAKLDTSRLADKLAVLFYYDGEQPTFAVLSNPDSFQFMLDRGLVQQQALYVQPNDTIEFGEHRIEVLKVGVPVIVCANFSCQVLNDYDRSENCHLCGTRLLGETRTLKVRNV